jgi:hypothetical protein
MTWPDSVVIPQELPKSLSISVHSKRAAWQAVTDTEWRVECEEMSAVISSRGESPEASLSRMINSLDRIYGEQKAPVNLRLRAMAIEHDLKSS